jgi:small subunit ribosomal protein S1
MEASYEGTFRTLNDAEIIMAAVVGLTNPDAILNVGYKSDSLVSRTEFRALSHKASKGLKGARRNYYYY